MSRASEWEIRWNQHQVMAEPEIERALTRVKAGWVEDYGTVVAVYHQRLRAAMVVWCPPGIEVDEIAHLTFVEAYRQLDRPIFSPGFARSHATG